MFVQVSVRLLYTFEDASVLYRVRSNTPASTSLFELTISVPRYYYTRPFGNT